MPTAPPVLRRIAVLLGWISLFATIALLSPGIVATANAEEAEQATVSAGASCPISRAADESATAELEQMIERLRSAVAEKKSAAGDGVVSLNTRGFTYPTGVPPQDDRR
jgi:hypothetical protein